MTKPIYLLCLHNVRTGGPEAIHQLSDALIEQGFDARMVYYDWDQIARLEQATPDEGYDFGHRVNPIEEYAQYRVNINDVVMNRPYAVVVLPETLCHLAPTFPDATVLIWWLSVDNGFSALSKVNLNHLRKPNVLHAWQSGYAKAFITALQLKGHCRLSDYTSDLSAFAAPLAMSARPPLVAMNATPHKVVHDIDALVNLIRKETDVRLIGRAPMARKDLAALFSVARLYVDLGSFPGRDRMPREACAMGCQVITAERGAESAHDVDEEILWEGIDPDTHSLEEISELVMLRVKHPDLNTIAGARLRFEQGGLTLIEREKRAFFREVKRAFEELCKR